MQCSNNSCKTIRDPLASASAQLKPTSAWRVGGRRCTRQPALGTPRPLRLCGRAGPSSPAERSPVTSPPLPPQQRDGQTVERRWQSSAQQRLLSVKRGDGWRGGRLPAVRVRQLSAPRPAACGHGGHQHRGQPTPAAAAARPLTALMGMPMHAHLLTALASLAADRVLRRVVPRIKPPGGFLQARASRTVAVASRRPRLGDRRARDDDDGCDRRDAAAHTIGGGRFRTPRVWLLARRRPPCGPGLAAVEVVSDRGPAAPACLLGDTWRRQSGWSTRRLL